MLAPGLWVRQSGMCRMHFPKRIRLWGHCCGDPQGCGSAQHRAAPGEQEKNVLQGLQAGRHRVNRPQELCRARAALGSSQSSWECWGKEDYPSWYSPCWKPWWKHNSQWKESLLFYYSVCYFITQSLLFYNPKQYLVPSENFPHDPAERFCPSEELTALGQKVIKKVFPQFLQLLIVTTLYQHVFVTSELLLTFIYSELFDATLWFSIRNIWLEKIIKAMWGWY